ncbi:hypothetical protein [Variovorax sp. EBFNA2]|uniref:hypothetical protein n=1 Tax=Variovorax sp. EBFNA2 TaxID=3342097 RepID=UPI0029BFCD7E|nr:hypothetical protein [Variovorax boronicumulans]WPG36903.1 hypothetical protein RZE79_26010 [Variovorax boronicumulans]
MKFIKPGALFALGFLCAALSACTDSNITAVKEASLTRSDFTFGEALDGAKGCKNTAWERQDDANGRPVVIYTCTAEAFDDIAQEAKKKALADLDTASEERANVYPAMITALQQKLAEAKKSSEGPSVEKSPKLQAAAKALQDYEAQVDEVMKSPINNPEWKRRIQLELARMHRQYEALKAQEEQEAPARRQEANGAVAKAQKELDDAASWQERYTTAVKTTRETVEKDINDYYGRGHTFKLRIQFAVSKKSPITPSTIEWLMDERPVVASILMPSFLYDPKKMEASLRDIFKDKVSIKAQDRYQEIFPIVCYYRWSDPTIGCSVKEK